MSFILTGDTNGCITHMCDDCGNLLVLDPDDVGLSHAYHIVKYHVPKQPSTSSSSCGNTASNMNPLPAPSTSSATDIISEDSLQMSQAKRKKISILADSILHKLKAFCQITTSSCNNSHHINEAANIFSDLSKSNTLLKQNKEIFEFTVLPVFKCKICNKNVPYHKDQMQLIQNFEKHLLLHDGDVHLEINPKELLEDLITSLPWVFRNTKCLSVVSNEYTRINCSMCDLNIPATVQSIHEHLQGASHGTINDTKLSIPSTYNFVNIRLQINDENELCLLCLSDVTSTHKHQHRTSLSMNELELDEGIAKQVKSFKCFTFNESGDLSCSVCQQKLPHILQACIEHILGPNHNKSLRMNLYKTYSLDKYTKFKRVFLAASTTEVFCLLCNLTVHLTEIEHHVALDQTHNTNESKILKMDIGEVLNQLPIKYRGFRCLKNSEGEMICQICSEKVRLEALFVYRHVLSQMHYENMVEEKLNILRFGVAEVKLFAQFNNNEFICLICKQKLPISQFTFHVHFFGNQVNTGLVWCFLKILKNVKCLVQTNENRTICSLCNCEVPMTINNLLGHILGKSHNKNLTSLRIQDTQLSKLQGIVQRDKTSLLCLDCNIYFPMMINDLNNHITKKHSASELSKTTIVKNFIKWSCLTQAPGSNELFCSLCECLVPVSVRKILEHLLGNTHNKKIIDDIGKLYGFIQVDKETVTCLSCNFSMSSSTTELTKHLSFHIRSKHTLSNLSGFVSQQFKNNNALLKTVENKVKCLACDCTFPGCIRSIHQHISAGSHKLNVTSFSLKTSSNHPDLTKASTTEITHSYFNYLHILKNLRCLIQTCDNRILCSTCSCDVPFKVTDMLLHIFGKPHNKKLSSIYSISSENFGGSSLLDNFVLATKNEVLCLHCLQHFQIDFNILDQHVKQSHSPQVTRSRSAIALNFEEIPCFVQSTEINATYCSICECMVPLSLRNILEHLIGRIHNKKIVQDPKLSGYFVQVDKDNALCLYCKSKLLISPLDMKNHSSEHQREDINSAKVVSQQFQNNKYLVRTIDDKVTCLLCQCTFPADMNAIAQHLSETTHIEKLNFDPTEFLPKEMSRVTCFLKTDVAQVICLVCNCFVPLSTLNLTEHILGRRHNNNK